MNPSNASLAEQKHALIAGRADTLRQQVDALLSGLPRLASQASADPHAQYADMLKLIAEVIRECERSRDLIAAAARQEPNPMPIQKIAEATGLARNTLRGRMPQTKQARSDDTPPF